ncbi:MAG: UDP-N-acetylmuramoyl-L-alanyl-D-glutamate--2,6-diaminopimelate ligase [Candidatus Calescibacterium sp.]|nr:UDP-N-acetylmuramoyl-L-alanyl-D-glutamate--2,6-diaminopimelate ligase [Candidatus Calescibacterium sp.]MCX7972400.1 UDP-N-acetylmuramoyl-L-alanyl-D-glutamate--2,6-diaminopimelate ligase [bacterium]MDW8195709.1 UDP-N-acetylmuramoyl-L-alanyl-D-glutamate--2,6-diaminopimelate ligase [Candidatus Calescibacterium sp.]
MNKTVHELTKFIKQTGFPIILENIVRDEIIQGMIMNTNLADIFSLSKLCYIAIKGQKDPLESYLDKILKLNPVLIITDKECRYENIPLHYNYIVLENLKTILPNILSFFYELQTKKLNIFGITGTNGKTTITTILYGIFNELSKNDPRYKSALIGTVKYLIDDQTIVESSTSTIPLTTPDICTNYYLLNLCRNIGIKNVFMEVSSHSLDQERINGIDFKVTAFTNLSRDHLDYHKTFKNYFEAKKKLFTKYKSEFKIINTNNRFGKILFQELKNNNFTNLIDFKIKRISTKIGINNSSLISSFDLTFSDPINNESITDRIETDLIGKHNLENLSIAFITSYIYLKYIFHNLDDIWKVKILLKNASRFLENTGRLEMVNTFPFVFIDYAHTPDALKKILQTLVNIRKMLGAGKLTVVFGAGGNRDKTKRPLMGKVAEKYADLIILTSDNPRNEDPLQIIHQIKKGITNRSKVIVELNRKKAIIQALQKSQKNDIILIAGKGHEKYQIIANQTIPFSDSQIVLEFFSKNNTLKEVSLTSMDNTI